MGTSSSRLMLLTPSTSVDESASRLLSLRVNASTVLCTQKGGRQRGAGFGSASAFSLHRATFSPPWLPEEAVASLYKTHCFHGSLGSGAQSRRLLTYSGRSGWRCHPQA